MRKILILSSFVIPMAVTPAKAIIVESGSKYPVVVEVYEWKSVCQDKATNTASKIVKGAKGAYNKGGFFSGLKEALVGAVTDAGCDRVGQAVVLDGKGQSVNLAAGLMIVAYKDPIMAYSRDKKVVNPLPAIKKIPASGRIVLETRKSSTLGSLIGMKGDGGLKATVKK
jgi:hypothetical protein